MSRLLNTIQKREKLNIVYAKDSPGAGNACHSYGVAALDGSELIAFEFQHGPRKEPDSIHGVIDADLLEIVRDRLKCFQSSDFACRENACALTHIEEALMWLNRRVEDRIERETLGTYNK